MQKVQAKKSIHFTLPNSLSIPFAGSEGGSTVQWSQSRGLDLRDPPVDMTSWNPAKGQS